MPLHAIDRPRPADTDWSPIETAADLGTSDHRVRICEVERVVRAGVARAESSDLEINP
jgi:hypothetical protein